MARPTDFNQEIADIICDMVSTTTKGLRRLCAENPELPDESTIHRWRLKHEAFREQYAEAKRVQAELLAEEIIEIADDSSHDVIYDNDGNERINSEFVNRSRLRVDTRKWIAAKLLPKVYGDRPQDDTKSAADTLIEKLLEKIDK